MSFVTLLDELERGGEVCVRILPELLKIGNERITQTEDLGTRDVRTVLVTAALARP